MRRALLTVSPLIIGLFLAGCPFFFDVEGDCGFWDDCEVWADDCGGDVVWPDAGSGSGQIPGPGGSCVPGELRYCDTPTYCSWGQQRCNADGNGWSECYEGSAPPGCDGFMYDQDCCIGSGACCQDWFDFDGDGDYDDSIGNCEEIPLCMEDADCENGYCAAAEGAEGVCVVTGPCVTDAQCEVYGPGLACDDRGICSPEDAPCPSGHCGCESDDQCDDGLLCIDSRCADPAELCFFDLECGEGAVCLNNECHASCEGLCPGGQECIDDVCLDPEIGSDGCVFDEDCGDAAVCINAGCFEACAADSDCGEGEACLSGACLADLSPVRECAADSDCRDGMSCQRGVCRLPCAASINCDEPMAICGAEGFCITDAEAAPSCTRASDCAEGQACLSNSCVAL